ncbi:hypothetical protein HYX09_05940 [Candidatus Woesearchaeota archaeon]|nr:hypothetical protein [Candidatus Woesearchaeota archaeon]
MKGSHKPGISGRQCQIFSLDMLIAMMGFVILIISASLLWDYSLNSIDARENRYSMELAASGVLSSLLETQGNPSNWSSLPISQFNESNIDSLGLAKNSTLGLSHEGLWEIDWKKLRYLNSSSYNKTKVMLGLQGYEFNLTVNKFNGSSFALNYSVSGEIQSANVVKRTRYALLDNKRAELVLMVGQNE